MNNMIEKKGTRTDMIANNLTPAMAVHPGELIRDEIEFRGIAQRELARRIEVSPTIINEVLKGKRQLGTELALLIGAALDIDAEPLIELQSRYNIYKVQKDSSFQKRLSSVKRMRTTVFGNA